MSCPSRDELGIFGVGWGWLVGVGGYWTMDWSIFDHGLLGYITNSHDLMGRGLGYGVSV